MANRVKNRRSSLLEDDVFAHSEKRSSRPRPKRDSANLVHGIVMRSRGHHFDVRTDVNDQHRARLCEIRGRLRAEKNVDRLGRGCRLQKCRIQPIAQPDRPRADR